MPAKKGSGGTRDVALLLKAIRGLPDREQRVVLAYLLERALEPAEGKPRAAVGPLGPSFITPEFVREMGSKAGDLLRAGQGIAGIAALYGIPVEAVRAALEQVASDPEGPQPLAAILSILAEGHSKGAAARRLGLSTDELARALEGLASSPLEARLGKALYSYAQTRAQASAAFAGASLRLHPSPELGARRHGGPIGDPEGVAARVGRLLLGGSDVGEIARIHDVPEDAVRAALREVAAHPDSSEPLSSILRLLAEGRTRGEVREQLEISDEEVTAALEELLPSALAHRLSKALQASAAVHSAAAPPAGLPWFAEAGSIGAEQQVVPVRFPEPQYRRLKEWCGRHGFSMAVVVRGLVERFLDDQERRAA